MIPGLAAPAALALLAGLIPLAAIYFFYSRSRTREISSLLFWADEIKQSPAGRKLERFRSTTSLVLETIIIILLALAAAGPLLADATRRPTIAVVLDDSLSMRAGDTLARGLDELRPITDRAGRVVAVLAREDPVTINDSDDRFVAEQWLARARTAELTAAIDTAQELAPTGAEVYVLTDQSPETARVSMSDRPNVQWIAMGTPAPNVAIADALRTSDRVLVEIQNHADTPATPTLIIEAETDPRDENSSYTTLKESALSLEPNQRTRLTFPIEAPGRLITLTLSPGDALAVDNTLTLAPPDTRTVGVSIDVQRQDVGEALERSLRATGRAKIDADDPQLVFTDAPPSSDSAIKTVYLNLVPSDGSTPLLGPFTLDRSSSITDGLDLAGIIWGVPSTSSGADASDIPLILAGSTPLLTIDEQENLTLTIAPDQSSLFEHPAWPVLIWNTINTQASNLPGVSPRNTPIGGTFAIRSDSVVDGSEASNIALTTPDGTTRTIERTTGTVLVAADQPGVYTITIDGRSTRVAVQPTRHAESDLRTSETVSLGSAPTQAATESAAATLRWIPLVLAGLVLLAHARLVFGQRPIAGAGK